MAVFRVEKSKDYTVMSNFHLRDSSLSLKAKGLLSQMLSLPEEWDYTLSGLAAINKEGVDAIRAAVQELEQAGYIQRRRTQNSDGTFGGNEYVIHEQPVFSEPSLENPTMENPLLEKPTLENPSLENPTELNIDILNKDLKNKDLKKKINKKEKPKGETELLSEQELRAIIVESVREVAGPEWSRDEMNDLYTLAVEIYNPKRAVQKNHPMRTKRSISRLFGNLKKMAGSDYHKMRDMLDKAIANGWQNVEQPHYTNGCGKAGPSSEKPREEVQYRCV